MSATYELPWAGCWAYVLHSKGEGGGVFKKQGSSAPSWLCDFSCMLKSLTHLSLPQFPPSTKQGWWWYLPPGDSGV